MERGGVVTVERWWHPNGDAALDPVEFWPVWPPGFVMVSRAALVRTAEAAGYVPDDRDAADIDEDAWTDDFGGAG